MLTKEYWKRLSEDVWTGFITGVATIALMAGFDVFSADWKAVLGAGLTGAVVAVVKAGVATPVGDVQSPRVVR
jgi:hypothetical protein